MVLRIILGFAVVFLGSYPQSDAGILPKWLCARSFSVLTPDEKRLFATATKEFPSIPDISTFEEVVRKRQKEWAKRHPNRPDAYPMPEHKPGVDWLKKAINDYPTDPAFAYRDPAQKKAEAAWRSSKRDSFLKEIGDIERRGYPHIETIELSERITLYLAQLNKVERPEILVGMIPDLRFSSPLSSTKMSELSQQWKNAETAIGPERRKLQIEYEKNFVAALEALGLDIGIVVPEMRRKIVEMHQGMAGLFGQVADDPRLARPDRGVFILSPQAISIRGLAEAGLFNVHPGGLTLHPIAVDAETLDPFLFLLHDRAHYGTANNTDLYAQRVIGLSREKKLEILRKVDSIDVPRKKQLAEFGLLAATRESVSTALRARGNDGIAIIQRKQKNVSGHEISEEEAKWILDWVKTNIPVRAYWF